MNRLPTLLLLAIAAALAGVLWMLRWDTTAQKGYPDTFWYTQQAATIAGVPADQAEELAVRASCRGQPAAQLEACENTIREFVAGAPDRYEQIFETRPGYPLLAAPFVAIFPDHGMAMVTALLGVLAGVLAALVVRLLGGSAVQSLAATVLLLLLPTGYWISRLLGEAATVAAALATLCAVTVVLQNQRSPRARLIAVAGVAVGLMVTVLIKPSSGVLLAAAIGGAAVLIVGYALARRWRPDRAVIALAGVSVAVVALWQVAAAAFDAPGLRETLQDMFTAHFARPDVPDPWTRLAAANVEFWPAQLGLWLNGGAPLAASPMLALLAIAGYVLVRVLPPRDAAVWLAVGATGLVTVAVHPVWSEVDRLMLFAWLPLAVGLAMVPRVVAHRAYRA